MSEASRLVEGWAMTDDNAPRGVFTTSLGIVTLLLLAGDAIARIAPDRMLLAGHPRLGDAIAAVAIPALYAIFGRLCAGAPSIVLGMSRTTLVRGLLAVFVVALAARMIDAVAVGIDPVMALGASLYWPDGVFAVLPALALLILISPWLARLSPFFLAGLGFGLFLWRVSTGIAIVDLAAANAIFFALGLAGHRLIDNFIAAIGEERGEVLLCATILVVVVLFLAGAGIARAPYMGLVLGFGGFAIVIAFACEFVATRIGAGFGWLGANILVVLVGVELPLALLGRGHANTSATGLAMIGFAVAATIGLAAFAARRARRGAAHALVHRHFRPNLERALAKDRSRRA
jgi:hypothetical protein